MALRHNRVLQDLVIGLRWLGAWFRKGFRYSKSEAWVAEDHDLLPLFDVELADALIAVFHDVKSTIDVGCGTGYYAGRFAAMGVDRAVGIEPNPITGTYLGGAEAITADVTAGDDLGLGAFDLAMSLEVVEHIPRERHDRFFDFLCSSARRYVVFAGGTPGQAGVGHIACRPETEWEAELNQRGWVRHPHLTRFLRTSAFYWWSRRNTMVFVPKGDPPTA